MSDSIVENGYCVQSTVILKENEWLLSEKVQAKEEKKKIISELYCVCMEKHEK